jgi:hypothetical protein
MRYCHNCHRITTGEPLYCNFCGRSYDVKLCPSRHPNPRNAEVCSTCGSREMSTPEPRAPFWVAPLIGIVSLLPGVTLLVLSIAFLIAFVSAFLTDPRVTGPALGFGLLLGLLWWLYMQLPAPFRRLFHRGGSKRKGASGHV